MKIKGWLQQQSRRRLFFILWAIYAAVPLSFHVAMSLIDAAWFPGHVFHGPPLWAFPGDVLSAALPAAIFAWLADTPEKRQRRPPT